MTVGKRIKERRIELNMSVDELAKRINKNRTTIYRYERGDIENLPIDVLKPIASALYTTPAWIMGWNQDKNDKRKNTDYETNIQYVDSLGEVIKNLRMSKNITLEEFANETGILLSDLKDYETGKSKIPEEILIKLAKFLGVTVDDLTSANITVNGTHMVYASNSKTHVRHLKLWYEAVGDVVLKDEELYKIIEYAKFLLYIRDK